MATRKIVTYPEKILRRRCECVKEIGKQERRLFDDMIDTMLKNAGVGLAASQIGENCRLFVATYDGNIYKIANPEIREFFGTAVMEEGCLSVPGQTVHIERFYGVILNGLNEKGEDVTIRAEGMLARIFQHEIDHLNGKLIVDYASQQFSGGH